MGKRHLTLRAAAGEIGCSIDTLRRAVWRGDLRCIRLTPARNCPILIAREELERWVEAGAQRQLAPRPGGNA